jgi:hypothetical protein
MSGNMSMTYFIPAAIETRLDRPSCSKECLKRCSKVFSLKVTFRAAAKMIAICSTQPKIDLRASDIAVDDITFVILTAKSTIDFREIIVNDNYVYS